MQFVQNLIFNIVVLICFYWLIKYIWKHGVDFFGLIKKKIENSIPSKDTQRPILKLIIIIGIVIIFIYVSCRIWTHNVDFIGWCKKKIDNHIPTIEPDSPTEPTGVLKTYKAPLFADKVCVYWGGNLDRRAVEKVGKRQVVRAFKGLDIVMEAGQIKITTKVLSSDGMVAAKITDNEWEINPNAVFRKNFDKEGLEVIDNYDYPVLQVDLLDKQTLKIAGFFEYEGTQFCITDIGFKIVNRSKGDEDLSEIKEMLKNQGLMFQYPTKEHFGERVNRPQSELLGRDERLSTKNIADKRKRLSILSNVEFKKQFLEIITATKQSIFQAQKNAPPLPNNLVESLNELDEYLHEIRNTKDLEKIRELLEKMDELPLQQHFNAGIQEYNEQFRTDIIAFYDEIAIRLGPHAKEMPGRVFFEYPKSSYWLMEFLNKLISVVEALE